jgi:FAD/FMN-containing dehydrogenase
MQILKPGRPPGWRKQKLTGFFESLWANTVATFAQKEEGHRLCRIDELMFEVASGWKGGSPTAETIVPLMMYFRAHSAFRSACSLGMGGATVEGMAGLRQSLEFAGYAALVHDDKSLARVWWDRDETPESEKKVRRSFTHGAVQAAIRKSDVQLADIYDGLYDRVIQFGAHPNEKSISGSLKLDVQKAETQLLQIYLQGDGPQLDHWLRTAGQVGICVLKVFAYIHVKRFADLGMTAKIDALVARTLRFTP